MQVLRAAGEELRQDEDLKRSMLGPLELSGIDRLTDNGVVIKGRIRTYAGESAQVGSAYLRLAKIRLDEAGVLISHRHQPVPPFDLIKDRVAAPSIRDESENEEQPASLERRSH
jgi:hypothetical protein